MNRSPIKTHSTEPKVTTGGALESHAVKPTMPEKADIGNLTKHASETACCSTDKREKPFKKESGSAEKRQKPFEKQSHEHGSKPPVKQPHT